MAGTTKNFSQGGPAEHGVPATSSQWQNPRGLNFGPTGDVYVTDALNHMVRRIDSAGIAHHVAGTGVAGSAGDGGDAKLAQLHEPHGVAVDSEGNVFIADSQNCVIRKVDAQTGIISRFAGTGAKKAPSGPGDLTPPCIKSDNHEQPGAALAVALDQPKSLYMTRKAGDDVLYVADFGNNMIRMIDTDPASGDPQTLRIAGTTRRMRYGLGFNGDALDSDLHHPEGVWVDNDGAVYFTDGGNHLVRKVTKSGSQWKIADLAGSTSLAMEHRDPAVSPNGAPGASDGDGGQALSARLNGPRGITGDSSGNLYVAEEDGSRIRRINLATKIIQTIAGDGTLLAQRNNGGTLHIQGDPSGNALEAQFAMLHDIQINPDDGSLWIADSRNNRVRAMADVASIAGANIPNGGTPPPPPPPGGGGTPVPVPGKSGYWMLGVDGKVYAFGDAKDAMFGDAAGQMPAGAKAVHIEPTPTAKGYWINDDRGAVYFFGDAAKHGGINASALQAGETVTSLSATPSGNGYWLFTSKGRVFNLGDAQKFGDLAHLTLNGAIQSSIPTPSGKGYFMVGSDGGVFAFGDAVFKGSMGATKLNQPVMSLVPTRDGLGYWLVASDGGIFAFGNAPFKGSMGATKLNKPVVGMVRYGTGYLMVGADGGIFSFSDKPFVGSLGANPPARPITFAATLDS
jgi:sugar lactone lactonase YvrE